MPDGHTVLLSSILGISRSVTVAIAYCMWSKKLALKVRKTFRSHCKLCFFSESTEGVHKLSTVAESYTIGNGQSLREGAWTLSTRRVSPGDPWLLGMTCFPGMKVGMATARAQS